MLMIAGGWLFALIKFCSAINPPNVMVVSAQLAITIAALGAAALAHSASRIASASLGATIPGFLQLLPLPGAIGCTVANEPEVYFERPSLDRNVLQSAALNTSVSSINTIFCPCPEMPAANSGFKLSLVARSDGVMAYVLPPRGSVNVKFP